MIVNEGKNETILRCQRNKRLFVPHVSQSAAFRKRATLVATVSYYSELFGWGARAKTIERVFNHFLNV